MIIATIGFQQFTVEPEDANELMRILANATAIVALPNTDGCDRYFQSLEPTLQLSVLPDSQLMNKEQSQEIITKRAERAERDHQQFTEQHQ